MAVYVDDMKAPYGRLIMCHMVADTSRELMDMVKAIGVNPRWIQHPGTANEHFDICLSKRSRAVEIGAKEITWREYARFVSARAEAFGIHFARASVDLLPFGAM